MTINKAIADDIVFGKVGRIKLNSNVYNYIFVYSRNLFGSCSLF